MNNNKPNLTYRDAGVDIEQADHFIQTIKHIAKRTHRSGVLNGIGGFGALFEIPSHYQKPILVSGTDGVGTKLKLAHLLNKHDTIGIDLVAMCVNDVITLGAEPLFFLDYFATGQLQLKQAQDMIRGIGQGCEIANCALIGGETAEMPGMYQGDDYDLAGFCVGVVEKDQIIDGRDVHENDTLIALASSGPHSNGYSLIRNVLQFANANIHDTFQEKTLGETLLTPTRIYVKALQALQKEIKLHAIAHITGGGITDNLPRVIPTNLTPCIDTKSWKQPDIFHWIQTRGNIADDEMRHTFNCGVGMIIALNTKDADKALEILIKQKEHAWIIGSIKKSNTTARVDYQ